MRRIFATLITLSLCAPGLIVAQECNLEKTGSALTGSVFLVKQNFPLIDRAAALLSIQSKMQASGQRILASNPSKGTIAAEQPPKGSGRALPMSATVNENKSQTEVSVTLRLAPMQLTVDDAVKKELCSYLSGLSTLPTAKPADTAPGSIAAVAATAAVPPAETAGRPSTPSSTQATAPSSTSTTATGPSSTPAVATTTAVPAAAASSSSVSTAKGSSRAAACEAYVGQRVTVQTFADVVAKLSKIRSQKDEYETTAVFEARKEAAKADLPGTFTIGIQLEARHLKYDADQGLMNVSARAFEHRFVDFMAPFGPLTPYYQKVNASPFFNIGLFVDQAETVTGSYKGNNVYGGTRDVTQISRKTNAIWEREAASTEKLFVDEGLGTERLLGSYPMNAEVAKAIKARAKAAVVVQPKWPFFSKGSRTWPASFNSPTEVTDDTSLVVGNIQAVLMLDLENRVLACYLTR
jgi:hypothetical protein